MIDFVSLKVIDLPGGREFHFRGEIFTNIKNIVDRLIEEGFDEYSAVNIIANKSKNKEKGTNI
jgi:hypothetical protein